MSELFTQPERPAVQVLRWLVESGFEFRSEVNINGCRVDFLIYLVTFLLVLEVDEKQHSAYRVEQEHERTTKLAAGLREIFERDSTRPIVVIRFNPDAYISAEEKKNPSLANRLTFLGMFLARYQPKTAQDISWLYFCFDTDMFGKVLSPFVESHEELRMNATPIIGDPDKVSQVPEKQLKAEQRITHKVLKIDLSSVKEQMKIREDKRKEHATLSDLLRRKLTEKVRQLEQSQIQKRQALAERPELGPGPTPGKGGIYAKTIRGNFIGYSIQFWTDGTGHYVFIGKPQLPRELSEVPNFLRQRAKQCGLTDSAIDKSLTRLKF